MQHPDEGTIHAWLDGALSAEEARALEAHVAGCAACAAAVSEARGILAASSRILSALDSVPGGVLPAIPPVEGTNALPMTVRRSSVWRSPGWRAAAAILVVGTVSWLATRSRGPSDVPTERAATTAGRAIDRPAAGMDTLSAPGTVHETPGSRSAAGGAAGAQPRVAAPSAAPSAAPRRELLPQKAAEPPAEPRIETRLSEAQGKVAARERLAFAPAAAPPAAATADVATSERDSTVKGAATGAMSGGAANDASSAMATRASARANALAEQRLAAPLPTMMKGAMPQMARAIAPAAATDAVERIAGCYALETRWTASAEHGDATALLPARVELTRDRDPSMEPLALLLRPAPGEPAFATGTRGDWKALGGSSVELQIRGGASNGVSAILSIAGDTVSGEARAYTGESAAPLVTAVKGRRVGCQTR